MNEETEEAGIKDPVYYHSAGNQKVKWKEQGIRSKRRKIIIMAIAFNVENGQHLRSEGLLS